MSDLLLTSEPIITLSGFITRADGTIEEVEFTAVTTKTTSVDESTLTTL